MSGSGAPKGVLWLLDTKKVLAFWSSSEVLAIKHLFTAASVWHGESIKVHVCPSAGAQVREYVTSRSRYPSGVQTPILSGEVLTQLSPSEAQESWQQFNLALGTLMTPNCWMRSSWKQTGGRLCHPHLGHPWVSVMALWEELMLTWMMGK